MEASMDNSCLLYGINRSLYTPNEGTGLGELRQIRDMFAKEIARDVLRGRDPRIEMVTAFGAYDALVVARTEKTR